MKMDNLTNNIIGAAIEVHRVLGPGLLESIYEEALCCEFNLRKIQYKQQVNVDIIYKNHILKGQRLDLIVENKVVIELKAIKNVPEVVQAQVLSYLRATKLNRALLINFNHKKLIDGIKRISL